MTYTIEKGVPLPHFGGRISAAPEDCPFPYAQMENGDSFAVTEPDGERRKKLRATLAWWAKVHRRAKGRSWFAVATRVSGDTIRVWAVPYSPVAGRKKLPADARPATSAPRDERAPRRARPACRGRTTEAPTRQAAPQRQLRHA